MEAHYEENINDGTCFFTFLVSCGNGDTPDYLQSVYEIDTGSYSSSEDIFVHTGVVSLVREIAVEEDVRPEVTLSILGQDLNLEYVETYRAVFDDFVHHKYKTQASRMDTFISVRMDPSTIFIIRLPPWILRRMPLRRRRRHLSAPLCFLGLMYQSMNISICLGKRM